jgi:hypothetical protein
MNNIYILANLCNPYFLLGFSSLSYNPNILSIDVSVLTYKIFYPGRVNHAENASTGLSRVTLSQSKRLVIQNRVT